MIDMTDNAVEQIKKAYAQANGAPPQGGKSKIVLRIAVKRAQEDGSFEYMMGFDEETDDDLVNRKKGVTIVGSPAYAEMLRGATLDFVELEPGDFQFIFLNPNDPNYVPPIKH